MYVDTYLAHKIKTASKSHDTKMSMIIKILKVNDIIIHFDYLKIFCEKI